MRTVTLKIKVNNVPDNVGDDEVAGFVNTMVNVGYADACDTADDTETEAEYRKSLATLIGMDYGRPEVV